MIVETGLILLRIGTDGGLCEGSNESLGSLKAITLLEVSTLSMDEVRIQGVQSKLYLAMDREGRLYGERRKLRSGAGDRTRVLGSTYQALSPLSYAEVQPTAPDRTPILQCFSLSGLTPSWTCMLTFYSGQLPLYKPLREKHWRREFDSVLWIGLRCSSMVRVLGHVACMGESTNAYRVLVGRPEGKRPLGRLRRRNVMFYLTTLATAEVISALPDVPEFCPAGVPLHASKPTDMSLSHLSRRLTWAGHIARMGESRNVYRVLVGRPEGKRPLGRLRRRWKDNIKMDLKEVGYGCRDWINLAQSRDQWRAYVRAAMNIRVDVNEEGTVFVASLFGYYNTYLSRKYAHLGWYVGIKKSGKPKRGSKTKWGQKAIQFLPRRLAL
ncbi:hypothetical protein ANN_18771 [Periplaneta americana]|uniref:Uncharacterized protein n=1 Tax=Periplaneta americana TaxID=6978 RepID=A0ABQ8SQS3_PERAM|nr:hypothetical protein ANN_18771 [Periplaneta americana]